MFKMKRRIIKVVKWLGLLLVVLLVIGLFFPTWTSKIPSEHAISQLRKVDINNTSLEVMIRGNDRNNPVLIFVHGGPCCSEIPYVKKYQNLLEKDFTIVHYDQRGCGKSYTLTKDYSDITATTHVEDLVALTKYIKKYLKKDKVILVGHSYGTYIATQAASKNPELFQLYVGIGQMSDPIESELDNLHRCMEAAQKAGNSEDVSSIKGLESAVSKGESIAPRSYVRKYGFAARNLDENADYLKGFYLGSEYNLLDTIGFYRALAKYQDKLMMETFQNPITELVNEITIPTYFVMGKYDGMTSPKAAQNYLNSLGGDSSIHKYVLFEESAHYPQFEEKEAFYKWICSIKEVGK